MSRAPRVCVLAQSPELEAAVEQGGGTVSAPADAEAIVFAGADTALLTGSLHDGIQWVQSGFAGNDHLIRAGLIGAERAWTSAAGVYAPPLAEHVLGLLLLAARNLHSYARARTWRKLEPRMLSESTVGVVGAGGVGSELVARLDAMGARTIAITRSRRQVPRATVSGGRESLPQLLSQSDFVVLSLPLTSETNRLIDVEALERMQPHAWLVNVARGAVVDTDALVAALQNGRIGGAALDTVDPEPLPDGHPLWSFPNAVITPHVAATWSECRRLLADRVAENVARFRRGDPLLGTIDPERGY